jgi:hypothetical protein
MTAAKDLYRIAIGARLWTLTSGDEEVDYASGAGGALEHYVPTPMGRGGVTVRNELTKANMEVRVPLTHELAVILLGSWLETITTITVFRQRASGTAVIWKGRLTSTLPDENFAKMVFESIYTSMRRPGLRARFQKSCRHPLYGRGCDLDPEDFAQVATIDAITGRTLTVPEADLLADGFFTGGMVKAPDGTLTYVTSHVGAQLELNRISAGLAAAFAADGPGTVITIYPGCDHSYATCAAKFSNDDNYGGFDYIPTKNPMGGSSIV